ncbi:MAG: L-aspartate oxidase [Candidatus Gracilibacteria bacterium]
MNLILTGMRCSGKTRLGRDIAKKLNRPFFDIDQEIEHMMNKKIDQFVKEKGWPAFRNLEKRVTQRLAKEKNVVISTGGGTFMDPQNAKIFKKNGIVIFLNASLPLLKKRLQKSYARPSLTGTQSSLQELDKIWKERKPVYERVADLIYTVKEKNNVAPLLKKIKKSPQFIKNECKKCGALECPCHTLIIGSGIAGLNFALHAAQYGKVVVLTKKLAAETGTNKAQGGIAAVLDKADRFAAHVQDTFEAGSLHNNRKAVEFMVKNGPAAVMQLVEFGVPFATDKTGKLLLTKEGGHHARRIAFVGDYTGMEIERILVEKVKNHPNIELLEHTFALDLLVKNKTCYGVRVIHAGKIQNLYAANTVLATGGLGQIYKYTTNPAISTGDGIAMGLRIGLSAKDIEFIQFHPTAFKLGGRTKFLLSEALRGEGALLKNKKNERFMNGVHPLAELAPRDVVARAVYQQDLNGGAFLDMRHLHGDEIKLRFPQIYQKLKTFNLDLTKDLIPIAPAAHYLCGGLKTNLNGETGVRNLYAFGEVAWTGVHGANRLASNSLLEALVFSGQVQKKIAHRSTPASFPNFPVPTYQRPTATQLKRLRTIQTQIRDLLWENVGIIRHPSRMQLALRQLQALEKSFPKTSKSINEQTQETHNMLETAKAVTQACIKRKKSLGNHWVE